MTSPWLCSGDMVAQWSLSITQSLGSRRTQEHPMICSPEGDVAPLAPSSPQEPPAPGITHGHPTSKGPPALRFVETPSTPSSRGAPMDTQQHPRDHPSTQSFRGHLDPPAPKGTPNTPQLQGVPGTPNTKGHLKSPSLPSAKGHLGTPAPLSPKGNPGAPQDPSST